MRLNNKNKKVVFVLYCLRLSLSLNKSKIGCVSTIKTKKWFLFCIVFDFHYL